MTSYRRAKSISFFLLVQKLKTFETVNNAAILKKQQENRITKTM